MRVTRKGDKEPAPSRSAGGRNDDGPVKPGEQDGEERGSQNALGYYNRTEGGSQEDSGGTE